MIELRLLGIGVLLVAALSGMGQTSNVVKMAPVKPPVLKSVIGKYGNNAIVSVEEAKTILALPLVISDANQHYYAISSYSFLFKRKGIVEDEETGKRSTAFTTVADKFSATPLPQLWITNINDGGFLKDEEFYFFDIVVKDGKGRLFYAPDLKIKIQ